MNESVIMPTPVKRPAPKSRGALVALVIALICGAVAAYEYRHSTLLNNALNDANLQSAKLQQQVATLHDQLDTATAELNELKKRNMPVTLIFRKASTGNGLITFFKNNAPSPLEVSVLLSNPLNHHSREAHLILPANGSQSIGETEGWVFAPGQRIQLTNAQFGSVDYVVPEQPQ
jgi:hypothetical protein